MNFSPHSLNLSWKRIIEKLHVIFPFTSTFDRNILSTDRSLTSFPREISVQKKYFLHCCSTCDLKDEREQNGNMEILKRRRLLVFLGTSSLFPTLYSSGKTKIKNPYDEKRLLEQNKRMQRENNAPDDFPSFVREGFEVKVVTSDNYVKCDSGLIYRDFTVGTGDVPKSGQQVYPLPLAFLVA